MNSLSWLIYCIGLLEPLSNTFVFGAVCFIVVFIAQLVIRGMCATENESPPVWVTYWKFPIFGFVLCLMMNVFLPSRQTAILIAGSELGGRLVTSDEVKNAAKSITDPSLDLLRTWIASETQRLKKDALEKASGGNRTTEK